MKKYRKLFSIFLVFTLVLSVINLRTYAAEENVEVEMNDLQFSKNGGDEILMQSSGSKTVTFVRTVRCKEVGGNVKFNYKVTGYFVYDRASGEMIRAYKCSLKSMTLLSAPGDDAISYRMNGSGFTVNKMEVSSDGSKATYSFSVTPVLRIDVDKGGVEYTLPTISDTMIVKAGSME